jgi:hypothetical protein
MRNVGSEEIVPHLTSFTFVDFAKVFDSPPTGAIWECLDRSGCPPDLSAVIMAIHDDPLGRLCGNIVFLSYLRCSSGCGSEANTIQPMQTCNYGKKYVNGSVNSKGH